MTMARKGTEAGVKKRYRRVVFLISGEVGMFRPCQLLNICIVCDYYVLRHIALICPMGVDYKAQECAIMNLETVRSKMFTVKNYR